MKYTVYGKVEGERVYTVEANSEDEAINEAREADLSGKDSDSEWLDIQWRAELKEEK